VLVYLLLQFLRSHGQDENSGSSPRLRDRPLKKSDCFSVYSLLRDFSIYLAPTLSIDMQ